MTVFRFTISIELILFCPEMGLYDKTYKCCYLEKATLMMQSFYEAPKAEEIKKIINDEAQWGSFNNRHTSKEDVHQKLTLFLYFS